jgi:hypothetical protein
VSKYKSKRIAGEPGTISYRGYKIYNNKGEEGAPYLIYGPGQSNPDDAAETLRDSKALIDGFLGKKFGGVIKKMRLGGLTSADLIGDKRRKEDATVLRKLKKTGKAKKIRTKPVKLTIQSASITKPTSMNIDKNTIMPKMMSKGGVVDMTRSIMINPETGE